MKHIVMLDIETLGVTINAQIIEVAAIYYIDGVLESSIQFYVDTEDPIYRSFFSQSKDTVEFHRSNGTILDRYEKAIATGKAVSIDKVTDKLNAFFGKVPEDTLIYCYGLNFDIPILESAAILTSDVPLATKARYRYLRDLRTEYNTALSLGFTYGKEATAHSAYADCIDQAKLLFAIFDFYNKLSGG